MQITHYNSIFMDNLGNHRGFYDWLIQSARLNGAYSVGIKACDLDPDGECDGPVPHTVSIHIHGIEDAYKFGLNAVHVLAKCGPFVVDGVRGKILICCFRL